jgi:hypothetical protein
MRERSDALGFRRFARQHQPTRRAKPAADD